MYVPLTVREQCSVVPEISSADTSCQPQRISMSPQDKEEKKVFLGKDSVNTVLGV
jgi:hypothetical protein